MELWGDSLGTSYRKESLQKRLKEINFRQHSIQSVIVSRWFLGRYLIKSQAITQTNALKKPIKTNFCEVGSKEQLVQGIKVRPECLENGRSCEESLQLLQWGQFGKCNRVLFDFFEDYSRGTTLDYKIV